MILYMIKFVNRIIILLMNYLNVIFFTIRLKYIILNRKHRANL